MFLRYLLPTVCFLGILLSLPFAAPAMGRPCTEKGSCRDLVYKCKLTSESLCVACKEHERKGDATLRRLVKEGKEKLQVCQLLNNQRDENDIQILEARGSQELQGASKT